MKRLANSVLTEIYRQHLAGTGVMQRTMYIRLWGLGEFLAFCDGRGMTDIREVNEETIRAYAEQVKGKDWSDTSVRNRLQPMKDLFRLLLKQGLILRDPTIRVDTVARKTPPFRETLTEEEIVRFLDAIAVTDEETLRDRALFELLYVTGMRIREASNLDVGDMDFEKHEVLIRQGKGRKDRIVPLGRMCEEYLSAWIGKARPTFARRKEKAALFIGRNGYRLTTAAMRGTFFTYREKAGITKKDITPHSIRHSCATHLLLHGADIRYVQELLGHEDIETTVKYTKGVAENLKRIHKRYHPIENELCEDGTASGQESDE